MDPLATIRARLESGDAVVAGCLSGTSADGIDVALTRFASLPSAASAAPADRLGAPELVAFETVPFEPALHERVRAVLDGADPHPDSGLGAVALLSRDLGLAFGRAVRDVARRNGMRVDLVGSHGQTVWHHDGLESEGRATLQLGEPAHVARASGATVAGDFRQADLAAGGEGAPLSALIDPVLFPNVERPAAILNLGGMANVTWLPDRSESPRASPVAFDTGPAGSLLDGLARAHLSRPFDEGGAAAARGRFDSGLLRPFLLHPFLDRSPPKSTGRDTFGQAWVAEWTAAARERGVRTEDLLATGVEFVAHTVALALDRFVPSPARVLVLAGGGAKNAALRAALERRSGIAVESSAESGVAPDAREAVIFAVLAARCALGIPSTQTWATGASPGVVLGALSYGAT